MCYIRETKETCDFIKRAMLKFKRIFNILDMQSLQGKIIYNLPLYETSIIKDKKIKKIAKKICKILYQKDIDNVVLSDKLGSNELFKAILYENNINILNGRKLFGYLIYNVVNYILKRQKKTEQTQEITILVNDINKQKIENIILFAKKFRRVNIVTNHIEKFRKIEQYLYSEYGIIINVSNNKSKSLLKSNLIINFDFTQELINKYIINSNAIIINILDKVIIESKKFNGININYYKINIPNKYKIDGFSNEVLYESIIYKENSLEKIINIIKKDNIKIKRLVGNKGEISNREFVLT